MSRPHLEEDLAAVDAHGEHCTRSHDGDPHCGPRVCREVVTTEKTRVASHTHSTTLCAKHAEIDNARTPPLERKEGTQEGGLLWDIMAGRVSDLTW